MGVHHLNAGAHEREALFIDDLERSSFLEELRSLRGCKILGYCLMDTHVHLAVESRGERGVREGRTLLRGHVLRVNARRGRRGRLLRAPLHATVVPDRPSLARLLVYIHENPLKAGMSLVSRTLDHVWSSQRELAGISRAQVVDVPRARELLGPRTPRVTGFAPRLADLDPTGTPTTSPEVVLVAAAQVHAVPVHELVGGARSSMVQAARRAFVRVGRLEGFLQRQLAEVLDRTTSSICKIAKRPVAREALRMTRTILQEPGLRKVAEIETRTSCDRLESAAT